MRQRANRLMDTQTAENDEMNAPSWMYSLE
jgi:hypothetical protein